jgi:hypothetical protein
VQDSRDKRLIFNNYNRVVRILRRQDSSTSWTYNSTSWRYANNNSNNQVTAVFGVDSVSIYLLALQAMKSSNVDPVYVGIGKDGVNNSGFAGTVGQELANAVAILTDVPTAGYHYFPWVERMQTAGTLTVTNTSAELCGVTGTMSM